MLLCTLTKRYIYIYSMAGGRDVEMNSRIPRKPHTNNKHRAAQGQRVRSVPHNYRYSLPTIVDKYNAALLCDVFGYIRAVCMRYRSRLAPASPRRYVLGIMRRAEGFLSHTYTHEHTPSHKSIWYYIWCKGSAFICYSICIYFISKAHWSRVTQNAPTQTETDQIPKYTHTHTWHSRGRGSL